MAGRRFGGGQRLRGMIWRLSLPIIFVEATETLDHLIDTLFLARVGVTELGAIGVADAVMLLVLILPLSFVDGMQILTARRAGQRRREALGAVFNEGFALAVGLALLAVVAVKLLSPLLAAWLVESREVGRAVDEYLQLDAFSIPLVAVTFAASAVLTSLGRTRILIPATLIVVVVDVILNYLFIFGKFGCPELGMRGAAVGSIGAELSAAVFLVHYLSRRAVLRGYRFFRYRGFTRKNIQLLGGLSGPLAGQAFLGDLRWLAFFLMVERMGPESLAVANVAFTCILVFSIPSEGFAEAVCSLVSRFIGRRREDRIGDLLRTAIRGAFLTTLPLILLTALAPEWLLAVFAPDEVLLSQSVISLRVVALGMLIAVPAELWFTAVQGTGDTPAALGIDIVQTLVMLGATYLAVVVFAWPISGVWLAAPLTWAVCLAASWGWMQSGAWKRSAI